MSSTAVRAEATAQPVAEALGIAPDRWTHEPRIYEASVVDLLSLAQELDDDDDRVLWVGHNPGFCDLARVLSREAPRSLPPAGVVRLHFEIEHWAELGRGLAVRTECLFPGDLR